MPRPTRITRLGFAYYAVLTIGVAVGLVIGGDTGDTVAGIAAGIFALTIFVSFTGGGLANRDAMSGRSRRAVRARDGEVERDRRDRD